METGNAGVLRDQVLSKIHDIADPYESLLQASEGDWPECKG